MLAEQEFEHPASRTPPWLLLQVHAWIPDLMALNDGLWPEVQAKQTPFSSILPYDLPHISYNNRRKSQHLRLNIFFPLILLYQAYPAIWIWKIIAWHIGYSYNLCIEVSDNKLKEQWLLNVLIFWDILIPSGGAYLGNWNHLSSIWSALNVDSEHIRKSLFLPTPRVWFSQLLIVYWV